MQDIPQLVIDQTFAILNEQVSMWIDGQAARSRWNRYDCIVEEHWTDDYVGCFH